MVASCTPCDASATVSRSGHFVALMRVRKSVSSASGTFTRNGRIALLPAVCSLLGCAAMVWVMVNLLLGDLGFLGWSHDAQTCLAIMVNIDLPTLAFGQ